ncbi:MAG: FkbM family methyltransferase [Alphaproteobacteria bacterium]
MPEINNTKEFITHILSRFFYDVHHYEGADNYDSKRFSHDGVDRSKIFNAMQHVEMLRILMAHQDSFFKAYQLLEDADSKNLFVDLIRFRLAGHSHVKLPTNTSTFRDIDKALDTIDVSTSTLELHSLYGPVQHCEFNFKGERLKIDSSPPGVLANFFHSQYYYERDGIRICPELGDYVVDAGAFLGDTSVRFRKVVGEQGFVYSFDPLDSHLRACQLNFEQNNIYSGFKLFNAGLADIVFTPAGNTSHGNVVDPGFRLAAKNDIFSTMTLDDLVARGEISRIDFIKMDVEGSELRALHGATETLRRFKPKLALSIYHYPTHFFELALFVHSLGLGYRFYLDHYTIHLEESVLYAISDQ